MFTSDYAYAILAQVLFIFWEFRYISDGNWHHVAITWDSTGGYQECVFFVSIGNFS